MLKVKPSKLTWLGIIVLGVILFGMPAVYAEDMERQRDQEEFAYEQTVDEQSFDLEENDIFNLGETDKDFVYTPAKPCRIVDTRIAGGKISSGGTRAFRVHGNGAQMSAQGGNPAGCPSPRGEPRAAHINIVAVNSEASGYLTVWPTGTGKPLAGVINYYPSRSDPISNAFTVKTGLGAAQDINVYAFKRTHVVSDVMGYYYEVDSVFIDEDFEVGFGNNPNNTTQFLADPARVSVNRSGQKIFVVSNMALGAGDTAAADLDLYICHQKTGATAPTKVGVGVVNNRVPANTRVTMGLSAIISVGPGTYDVGLCGDDDGDGNWTSNEYSYTTAFVVE